MRERPRASIVARLNSAPQPIEIEGVRVYRLKRFFLALGVGATVFFGSFGLASVVAAWWNLDCSFRYPRATAIGFGVVLGGFTLLGSYMILGYYRERLFVSDVEVFQHGCFTRRSIWFSNVTSAQWRITAFGPYIILRDPHSKIVVHLNQWGLAEDWRDLIRHFRESIHSEVQQDWETFEFRDFAHAARGQIYWRSEAWLGQLLLTFAVIFVVQSDFDPSPRGKVTMAAVFLVIGTALVWHAWRRKNRAADAIRSG
jgi:hypothetical protein